MRWNRHWWKIYKKILKKKVIKLSSLIKINQRKSRSSNKQQRDEFTTWTKQFRYSDVIISIVSLFRKLCLEFYIDPSISLVRFFFSRIREEDLRERRAFAQESKNPRSLDPRYIRGGKRNSGLFGRGSFNVHRLDSSISSIVVATGRARGIPRNFVKVTPLLWEKVKFTRLFLR